MPKPVEPITWHSESVSIAVHIHVDKFRLLARWYGLRAALLSDAPPPWNRVHEYYDPETIKSSDAGDRHIDRRPGGR
jgi:hypothetical protein